jgi:hypothetical protein
MRTYVVTKDTDGLGRNKVMYAGQDADEAKRIADVERETDSTPRLETFIEVWVEGEHQFVTREHPTKFHG